METTKELMRKLGHTRRAGQFSIREVQMMREEAKTKGFDKIAEQYGCSVDAVRDIVNRRTYKGVK